MENATKALEMAGSVLIGVLLLGCLLFAYTRMSELKDTEHKVEVSEQAKDFNQDYETYNRNNLYGSDLFSLANQIEDYNKKEADGKAYGRIEMKVTLKIHEDYFRYTKEVYQTPKNILITISI
jgi:leucyl-tRNA synthetase